MSGRAGGSAADNRIYDKILGALAEKSAIAKALFARGTRSKLQARRPRRCALTPATRRPHAGSLA
eukprot:6216889-Prymnesium_polylepis.1